MAKASKVPATNPVHTSEKTDSTRVERAQSTRVEKPQLSQTLRAYIKKSELMPKLDAAAPELRRAELRKCRDAGVVASVMQGYWLADIQASEGGEALRTACAELNIGKSTCYYSIAQFHLFNQFEDLDVVQALGALEPTKFRALSFQPDEWSDFARGEPVKGITLDSAVEMSQRELLDQQRQWQADHDDQVQTLERDKARLQNQLDTERNRANLLARAGATLLDEADLPRFALTVRQESLALTEQIGFALDNLDTVVDENLLRDVKHPEAHRWQPVSASTCFYALSGALARGHALLERIREAYPDHHLTAEVQLRPAEITRFQEQRAQLLATHEAKARQRETARENATPGKRGAKRKG